MLRIALCDDNTPFLEYEKGLVEQYLEEKNVDVQCDSYMSGQELLDALPSNTYDLYILDYEMDGLNGFETASRIYEIDTEARIAFATNYYDFTRLGYKYHVIRYLVKLEKSFKAELEECIDCILEEMSKMKAVLELNDGVLKVDKEDIIYIGSDKHYIKYFIRDIDSERCLMRGSLDEAQKDLPKFFVRVHQRYIVNMKHVKQVKRYTITLKESDVADNVIPIARRRYDDVKKEFNLLKGV